MYRRTPCKTCHLFPRAIGVLAFRIKDVENGQNVVACSKPIGKSLALCTDFSANSFRDREYGSTALSIYKVAIITTGETDFDCF